MCNDSEINDCKSHIELDVELLGLSLECLKLTFDCVLESFSGVLESFSGACRFAQPKLKSLCTVLVRPNEANLFTLKSYTFLLVSLFLSYSPTFIVRVLAHFLLHLVEIIGSDTRYRKGRRVVGCGR